MSSPITSSATRVSDARVSQQRRADRFERWRDPALWLGLGVAAPYFGMLAYFVWQIARAIAIS